MAANAQERIAGRLAFGRAEAISETNRITEVAKMTLHVREAKYLHDYVVWLRFNDSAEGEVDLASELEGEVFGPLRDKSKFRDFHVDPEMETIVWSNGADLAPEFLYENMKVLA